MAEKKEQIEELNANETKKTTNKKASTGSTARKKVTTGNTKKLVEKRSSSTAGKKTERNASVTKTTKRASATKTESKEKKETSPAKKKVTAKKETPAKKEKTKKEEKEKKPTAKLTKVSSKKSTKEIAKESTEEVEKEPTEKIEEEIQEKAPNTKLQKKKKEEIAETVGKEIKANRKLPEEELNKINTRVFQNIGLAVIVMFYLNFLVLGFMNIEQSVFITDLKVFSMAILATSIIVFEYAYKKDSGRCAIHGIEILLLAFITMGFVYTNLMWEDKFTYVLALVTYIYAIYYVAKAILVYNRMKKEYFVNTMKEMIKK